MKVNIEKFENTLIKNWTEFIEIREFLTYARTLAINYLLLSESSKVTKLSFSRFELSTEGFIVWIEYILSEINTSVNTSITSELILDFSGNFHHIKSIINPSKD